MTMATSRPHRRRCRKFPPSGDDEEDDCRGNASFKRTTFGAVAAVRVQTRLRSLLLLFGRFRGGGAAHHRILLLSSTLTLMLMLTLTLTTATMTLNPTTVTAATSASDAAFAFTSTVPSRCGTGGVGTNNAVAVSISSSVPASFDSAARRRREDRRTMTTRGSDRCRSTMFLVSSSETDRARAACSRSGVLAAPRADGGCDVTRRDDSESEEPEGWKAATITTTTKTRREALVIAATGGIVGGSGVWIPSPRNAAPAHAASTAIDDDAQSAPFGLSNDLLSSLQYERILGKGSFKTVYLVVVAASSDGGGGGNDDDGRPKRYAMAVERVATKTDAKDALRGIRIAQSLQRNSPDDDDDKDRLFERICGWWVQSVPISPFDRGRAVFPHGMTDLLGQRTTTVPNRFLGSKWIVSFKPAYEMDLKAFVRRYPVLLPVGGGDGTEAEKAAVDDTLLAERFALNLAHDLCRAGRLMHDAGIVHRDVKPKNVMLTTTSTTNGEGEGRRLRPVLIDFGFAEYGREMVDTSSSLSSVAAAAIGRKGGGEKNKTRRRVCVVQQGRVKGEVRYVLAPDVTLFRGCQEGDAYAMGKTLYEVIFGAAVEGKGIPGPPSSSSGRQSITESDARDQNVAFRALIARSDAGASSRFRLSPRSRDALLGVVRGLCREDNPMSFAEAEQYLLRQM